MAVKSSLLPRYLLTFGPWHGMILFIQVECLKSENVKLRELKFPLQLRRNSTDGLVFREVFLFQSYNLSWSNPKVIVDGGGNIGLTSLFFAQKFPKAKIFSVEPSDSNFECLLANVKCYPSIVPVHSALWNKDTSLRIQNLNEHQWAFTVQECSSDQPLAFQAVSIASLMKKFQIGYIDILKLDIEGAERELFTDNYEHWLSHTRCILIELHDWIKPDCSKTVFGTLSKFNFKMSIFNDMLMLTNTDLV